MTKLTQVQKCIVCGSVVTDMYTCFGVDYLIEFMCIFFSDQVYRYILYQDLYYF